MNIKLEMDMRGWRMVSPGTLQVVSGFDTASMRLIWVTPRIIKWK